MKWILAAAVLGLSAPAFADYSSFPQPLAQALELAQDSPEGAVWRFTFHITIDGEEMTARFDGTQPDGADWTLLSPASADELSDPLAEIWTDMNTVDDAEEADDGVSIGADGLFFDEDAASMVSGGIEELGDGRYAFRPNLDPDAEEPDPMADNMTGEVALSANGYINELRIFAPESFKPNAAARVHTFEMRMTFDQLEGFPAPIMISMATDIEVSALFQRQSQSLEFRFSDVEYTAP
ncbi:hypothetical protein [Hyphobacterium sp.]|uniref:hypothetical protein n=1 Tax=Hyphobacterium sp. TaxID=2004662 RepID=UPI003BAA7083